MGLNHYNNKINKLQECRGYIKIIHNYNIQIRNQQKRSVIIKIQSRKGYIKFIDHQTVWGKNIHRYSWKFCQLIG
jgi:hypothetical protein